jgi:hypothetical protein
MRPFQNMLISKNNKVLCPAEFHDSTTRGGCTFLKGYLRREMLHIVNVYRLLAC